MCAELLSTALFLCKLDPAAPTASVGEGTKQGKIKANVHLRQLCLPEKGNTRLTHDRKQTSGSLIVHAGLVLLTSSGITAVGVKETQRPGWRLRLIIPVWSPQILERLWLQQLRKQNKTQFTSILSGSRRISWQFEILLLN